MLIYSQSLYKKIFSKLSKAKKSGSSEDIRKSLRFFSDSIRDMISKNKIKLSILSDFVHDENMFFKAKHSKLSNDGPDLNITTNGLIAQMLDMILVKDYEKISDDVSSAIDNLYAKISVSKHEALEEKEKLIIALDYIDRVL